MDGWVLDWSLDLAAAVLSLSGRPILVAHCNTEHPWHFICALLLWLCPPHYKHTLTHPLHHSSALISGWILISACMWTKQDVRHWLQQPYVEGYYIVIVEKKKNKKSNLSTVESLTCKRHHTFIQTGITLWMCPQSNCKCDFGTSPQTAFPSAWDKPPFRATFLFTFTVR